eukprot:2514127-Rhodomonas_salina.2
MGSRAGVGSERLSLSRRESRVGTGLGSRAGGAGTQQQMARQYTETSIRSSGTVMQENIMTLEV